MAGPEQIRAVLAQEVPEFRLKRNARAVLSVLFDGVLAVSLCSFLALALAWFITRVARTPHPEPILAAAAVAAPLLGLVVGFLTRNSTKPVGLTVVEDAMSRQTVGMVEDLMTFKREYTLHDQIQQVAAGCLLFFLQVLAGSVYSSVASIVSVLRKSHEQEHEVAVEIVSRLLSQGPTPASELASSGAPREQVRDALVLLQKAELVKVGPETVEMDRSKRYLFDPIYRWA